jgi:hypothetical protein
MSGELNPNLDPRVVGPFVAAVNWYWAVMCVPLSASIWAPGAMVRAARRLGL